ncbi:prohead protease/major capsid protein fusion protein [Tianweitania sediminis]|uniref:HK97 family phage prohead protease n=1 Tax=Tianweitania sediminis TaxID=1502156 RepID=A0A8J7R1E5_9HYPH|nr:prohead protease/major capsid protein fusion protein [Tianweitania sediminis]MBP0439547.1 HK97 family phage prohead protease [Tianweitania sediminis]
MTRSSAGGAKPPGEGARLYAPEFRRSAEIGSFNPADNSVEVLWTTGAAVRRQNWVTGRYYNEILEVTPEAVDLARLNAGAPLLAGHDTDLRAVIGSVVPGSAVIRNGKGYARVGLSAAAGDADLVAKIRTGIIRNVSVGYRLIKVVVTEQADDDDEWRVVSWEPFEISAVAVGADPGAHFRSTSAHFEPCQFVGLDLGTASQERTRASTIAELAESAGEPAFGLRHVAAGTSIQDFRHKLLELLVEREAPHTDGVLVTNFNGNRQRDQQRASAIQAAILHRINPTNALPDGAREFRGMGLIDMARDVLEAGGISTRGMNRQEIAAEALMQRSSGMHTTSDFSVILGSVVSTSLRAGYESAPQTFRPLVRETTVSDFKEVTRAQLGEAPRLEKVNEHGEYKRGTIGEGSEKYRAYKFGKIIGITREVIVNDDLNAFGRIPQMFGVAAAQLESDLVWAEILGNPVMGDGTALFHANHNNLASAAALAVAPIGAMRAAMAKQTGLDKKTVLNISPAFVIVPVELETKAEQLLRSVYQPTNANDATPASMRRLGLISEPRLDNGVVHPVTGVAIAGSNTAWYLAASPGQIDTVELAYLEGNRGVYTESKMAFNTDGIEIKARMEVGAKVIDWRAFQKNAGA